jgi:WD40 repeat protein
VKTIRIFISSPGDVNEERVKARQVIEQLKRIYSSRVDLQAILWEDLPLGVDASFQQGIDLILSGQFCVDIAVFILWSRLGTPLGPPPRRDGAPYRSGTEREFDLMMEARRQSEGKHPHIIAYQRMDDESFHRILSESSSTLDIEKIVNQRKLAEGFISETFQDEKGRNVRAIHTFDRPLNFASRLKVHLQALLDEMLGDTPGQVVWDKAPYRGLHVFDLEHAPIFFGREAEVSELEILLRRRAEARRAFAVIVGASGSGKSSLARSGLAASLVLNNLDAEVHEWRHAVLRPSATGGELVAGLVQCMAGAIPELLDHGVDPGSLASVLKRDPADAIGLNIMPAFSRASERAGGAVKLLLIIDQMEELWTDPKIADQSELFLTALEWLACTGCVWVLATLRTDFYPLAQLSPAFVRLKESDGLPDRVPSGQYDLVPPGLGSIQRMITEPARIAGLRFESTKSDEKRLDHMILQDAAGQPDALPLLEYALELLYERRSSAGLLQFETYREIGGVEGALGQKAESVFTSLPAEVQAVFGDVFQLLVLVDADAESQASRRSAALAEATNTPQKQRLVQALVDDARCLTSDQENNIGVVRITHEALLRRWDRLVAWIAANREYLRIRTRIEQAESRWNASGKEASLLLRPGFPLEEGRRLLDKAPSLCREPLVNYIRASLEAAQAETNRVRRIRQSVLAAVSLLAVVAVCFGIYGFKEAGKAREQAKIASDETEKATKNKAEANASESSGLIGASSNETGSNRLLLLYSAWRHTPESDSAGRALSAALTQDPWPLPVAPTEVWTDLISAQWSPDSKKVLIVTKSALEICDANLHVQTKIDAGRDSITCAVWSPDEKLIAAGFVDGTIEVWKTESTGHNIKKSPPAGGRVKVLRFSGDSKYLVALNTPSEGDTDYMKGRIWNIGDSPDSGTDLPDTGSDAAFVGTPAKLITFSNKACTVRSVDDLIKGVSDAKKAVFDCGSPNHCLAANPVDERFALGVEDSTLRLVTAELPSILNTEPPRMASEPPILGASVVTAVRWLPDGQSLIIGMDNGYVARYSKLGPIVKDKLTDGTQDEISRHGVLPSIKGISVGKNGRCVAYSESGDVLIFMAEDSANNSIPLHLEKDLLQAEISPAGDYLLLAFKDGGMDVLSLQSNAAMPLRLAHSDDVSAAVFCQDCGSVMALVGPSLYTWNLDNLSWTKDDVGSFDRLSYDCSMHLPIFTSGKYSDREKSIGSWSDKSACYVPTPNINNCVTAMAYSEETHRLATLTLNGVHLWSYSPSDKKWTSIIYRDNLKEYPTIASQLLAFSPDGKMLLTNGDGTVAKLWQITDQQILPAGQINLASGIDHLAFNSDSTKLALTLRDGTLLIKDLKGWPAKHDLPTIASINIGSVNSLDFSPHQDSPLHPDLLAAATNLNTIYVIQLDGGKIIKELQENKTIQAIQFRPQGDYLLAQAENEIHVWDMDHYIRLDTHFVHQALLRSAVFCDGGEKILALDGTNAVTLWPMPPGMPSDHKEFIDLTHDLVASYTGEEVDGNGVPSRLEKRFERLLEARNQSGGFGLQSPEGVLRWLCWPADRRGERPLFPGSKVKLDDYIAYLKKNRNLLDENELHWMDETDDAP